MSTEYAKWKDVRAKARAVDPRTDAERAAGAVIMRATHEELLQLAEAVPDDQVQAATVFLRQLVRPAARREFSCAGTFSAEPDLAERAKEIVREELDRSATE